MSTMTKPDNSAPASSTAAPAEPVKNEPEKITLSVADADQIAAITDYAALHGISRTPAAAALFGIGVRRWLGSHCEWQESAVTKSRKGRSVEKITLRITAPDQIAALDAYTGAHGGTRTSAASALFRLGVQTWLTSGENISPTACQQIAGVPAQEVMTPASSSPAACQPPASGSAEPALRDSGIADQQRISETAPDRTASEASARDLALLLRACRSPQILTDALQHAYIYNGAVSDDLYDAQDATDFIVSCDDGDEQSPAFGRCLQVIKEAVGLPHDEANFGLLRRVFLQKKRALREACKSNARAIARQVAHRLVTRDAVRNAFFSAPVALHGADLSADFDSGIEAMAEGEISWDALAVAVRECLREGTS